MLISNDLFVGQKSQPLFAALAVFISFAVFMFLPSPLKSLLRHLPNNTRLSLQLLLVT